ncbi:MAG: sulfite exporter TauE/SafE family protein [Clostridia bacterium]|nr:sulfite exporter TauE/SafE family protein [Clostridia bacterium]
MDYILLILVGIGAGFVQRVSGFGLGIFAMLFMPHFLPSATAAASISCLFSCGTSTYNAVRYRKDIPFRTVLPMMIAAMITIPVAVFFSAKVSQAFFEVLLGIILIVISLWFLFFDQKIRIRPTIPNGILAGALGGTLNGLFSTGGPPVVLYLSQAATNPATYFAGIQFYFCITNIYATVMRAVNGLVTWELLLLAAVGMIGCMAGDFIGKKVFDKLDGNRLKKVIYIGMILSGILMVL